MKLGIIGGSGIYEIEGVKNGKWIKIVTPFGDPSDHIFTGYLNAVEVAFLPRHGRGHIHSPSSLPFLANIYALKEIGVTDIISLSACGSLQEHLTPGDFVLVDQFIDRTFKREKSFFSRGCVAHVSVAEPICGRVKLWCKEALEELNLPFQNNGTYLVMEGPQFSTKAESRLYREQWNCDVIGMTNMPEAKLAREAEMCYASVAMVTDFDCWHPEHENVEVSDIVKTLVSNADNAKNLIKIVTQNIRNKREACPHGCDKSLEYAIITDRSKVSKQEKSVLGPIAKRVLI